MCKQSTNPTDVNECVVDNPCENDAVCINEVGDFRCECTEGFTGKTCATGTFVNITFSFLKWHNILQLKTFIKIPYKKQYL